MGFCVLEVWKNYLEVVYNNLKFKTNCKCKKSVTQVLRIYMINSYDKIKQGVIKGHLITIETINL